MDEGSIRPRTSLRRDLLSYRAMCEEHGYPLPDDVVDELAEPHGKCRYDLFPLLENFEALLTSIGHYMGEVPTCHDGMRLFYGRLQDEFHLPQHVADRMHPHHLHWILILSGGGLGVEGLTQSLKQICSDRMFQELDRQSFHDFCYAAMHMLEAEKRREADDRARKVAGLAGGATPQLALEGPTPAGRPPCRVTLAQAAAAVSRSPRTLERYIERGKLPVPAVEGGGGKPHLYNWAEMRPILESEFGVQLPEQYWSLRQS